MHMNTDAHRQKSGLALDDCKIECACGCHSSIDSLPQLLAPHLPVQTSIAEIRTIKQSVMFQAAKLQPVLFTVESPPPRSI